FLERGDIEKLKDATEATSLITEAIGLQTQPHNLLEIFKVIDEYDDSKSKAYINDDGLNIPHILADRKNAESRGADLTPFLGIIYTPENWRLITEILEKNVKQPKQAGKEVGELIWLAPNNPFWGKSEKVLSCLQYVRDSAKTKGKKAKKLYQSKLYLPLTENHDRLRRNAGIEFEGFDKDSLFGYTGDFCNGNVEVIVNSDLFAVVIYHVSAPEISPIPIPFGFRTTDKSHIAHIRSRVKAFLNGTDMATGKTHDVGLLSSK
ncbi:hypothetical protein, partial [Endozoicomonas acroporae]|uniref:hypothetical protein n=1 Tax=Endozoicomonas acroporae TaxID=1701104 RepID=UPI003D795885